ncbi:DNA-directed RNA polymerase subunit alpha [Patescibacteria group bacterium]|jgi:DNA-directed RNA polymerase subunit alpha|nr:DNA-directed RNA polymerase subunit alpha [Patescibacteria group bacterium]
MDTSVALPSKPRVVREEDFTGIYEIDGLFPGYGHTLGNSLRRIILSSLPGAAITTVTIEGVQHEFATIEGVHEDVLTILLNLKRVRLALTGDDPQTMSLSAKGPAKVTAADITAPGQVEILNPDQHIADLTGNANLSIEMAVEKGLGYVGREMLQQEKMEVGSIAIDATFTPIRRVNYEVENMRVGDRTDFNRLRIFIETDGTLSPREAFERSVEIMIYQLKSIVGFKEEEILPTESEQAPEVAPLSTPAAEPEPDTEVLKTRIESLEVSGRTINVLSGANIRTIGGLARKKEEDILSIEGIGIKGLQEVKDALAKLGVSLKG